MCSEGPAHSFIVWLARCLPQCSLPLMSITVWCSEHGLVCTVDCVQFLRMGRKGHPCFNISDHVLICGTLFFHLVFGFFGDLHTVDASQIWLSSEHVLGWGYLELRSG